MDIVTPILVVTLMFFLLISSIQEYYDFRFEWVEDVNLNKVLIVWYNDHTEEGVVRKHKIIYDTGRYKK